MTTHPPPAWHQCSQADALKSLHAGAAGLSHGQAAGRLRRHGHNLLQDPARTGWMRSLLSRLGNPLVLVLLAASIVSAFMGDRASFGFVAVVVLLSIALDLFQEHRAARAVDSLRGAIALRVRARRDGRIVEMPARRLVPGDVVLLSAGDLVPADGRILVAAPLFVNQASLTGEPYPVEKRPCEAASPSTRQASDCAHAVFMGSSVVSGSAEMLVCETGMTTSLGHLAHALDAEAPPSAFEKGTRRFSALLARWTLAMVLFVLLVNTLQHKPLLESFMFAVALAVGLTPELLPMIVSVTLARGALRLAAAKVIVKRLSSVQDLGAMDVLCTDKTGTLTEARPRVERTLDADGAAAPRVFELAWLNSHFQSGLRSALDDGILQHGRVDAEAWQRLGEVPFDFERRRVSVLLANEGRPLLIVKGAPEDMLRLSTSMSSVQGPVPLDAAARDRISRRIDGLGSQGLRLLAVATREWRLDAAAPTRADETDLRLTGFIAFADPPKASAAASLHDLAAHGVAVKIVTGDTEAVTRHLCGQLGVAVQGVLSGERIADMDEPALRAVVDRVNLFCRVTPAQKHRVVCALRAAGHVVGHLGDGINDAPALHAADVGISVDSAVDVARQAADMVLLERDLGVLCRGIREGRRSHANVTKYVLMATSSNFGNMVSMAASALFLPFLPMLPLQILLNNFLYDVSELPIPTDRVDDADLRQPPRWDAAHLRNFMLCFGLASSLFDLAGFALLRQLGTSPAVFQTAWFVQSMATQVLAIFIIRTPRPAWRDLPSRGLAFTSLAVVAIAWGLPFSPWAGAFGFAPWPAEVGWLVLGLTAGYLVAIEFGKRLFHRRSARPAAAAGPLHPDAEGARSAGETGMAAAGGPA
jgi:Mg2+-importing ATPase